MNVVLLCWLACVAVVAVSAQQLFSTESRDTNDAHAAPLLAENWERTVSMLRNQLFSECAEEVEDMAIDAIEFSADEY